MRKNDIKSISIRDFLKNQGVHPAKEYSAYGMYKSPLRDEETASFKVDYKTNLWYDFGTGEGGSIIDLVMQMQQCNFIQAVEFLEKHINQNVKTYQRPYISTNASISANNSLSITAIQPLENTKLLAFLQSRKIDLGTAKTFCKEIKIYIYDDRDKHPVLFDIYQEKYRNDRCGKPY